MSWIDGYEWDAIQEKLKMQEKRIAELEAELSGIMSTSTGVMLQESLERETRQVNRVIKLQERMAELEEVLGRTRNALLAFVGALADVTDCSPEVKIIQDADILLKNSVTEKES